MKKSQRGFVVPLLVVLVAVIGGGVYIYKQKQQFSPPTLPFEDTVSDSWSVEQRQQYYDALLKVDSNTLFTLWKKFEEKNNDPTRQNSLYIALSDNLTLTSEPKGVNAPVYQNISSFLAADNNKIGSKIHLVNILGQTITLPSLQILLDSLNVQSDSELLLQARKSILTITQKGPFHEEFSPLLEEAYQKSTDDKKRSTFSSALAKIGAPSGITLLLKEALRIGQNNSNFIPYALSETRNANAIPVLAKGLRNQQVNNFELIVSGETLAVMGKPEATKAIIEWAKGADSNVALLVKSWLSKMRDDASIKLVKYTLENNELFKSDVVRKAVKDGLNVATSQSMTVQKLQKGTDY